MSSIGDDACKDKDTRSSKKNIYKPKYPVKCPFVHDTHCPLEDKGKDKDKYKDGIHKRSNIR